MRRLIDGGLSVHFGEDRTKSILISEAIGLNKINMNINIYIQGTISPLKPKFKFRHNFLSHDS